MVYIVSGADSSWVLLFVCCLHFLWALRISLRISLFHVFNNISWRFELFGFAVVVFSAPFPLQGRRQCVATSGRFWTLPGEGVSGKASKNRVKPVQLGRSSHHLTSLRVIHINITLKHPNQKGRNGNLWDFTDFQSLSLVFHIFPQS